jgi:membrane-associated protease RseP (regulator of RpoE activity)
MIRLGLSVLLLFCVEAAQAALESHYEPNPSVTAQFPPRSDAAAIPVIEGPAGPAARAHVTVGRLALRGPASTTREEFLSVAREKAAAMGVDFVAIVQTADNTRRTPGPRGNIGGLGYRRGDVSMGDAKVLYANLGVYAKGTLGIEYMDFGQSWGRHIVKGFRQDSRAPVAGLQPGDEILEVDGIPPRDSRYADWVLRNQPGQMAKLLVKRGESTFAVDVPLVPNI